MLLTEEEAKTKWCPKAMVVAPDTEGEIIAGAPVFNRAPGKDPNTTTVSPAGLCLASDCMAWRWGYITETESDDPNGLPAEDPRTGCDVKYIGENSTRRFLPRKGFCGLAMHMTPQIIDGGY